MNRRLFSKIGIITLSACIAGGILSCAKDNPADTVKLQATSIELVSGGDQSALAGQALASPVVVMVADQNGNPFAGEAVTFAVTEGSVSAATATTDAKGKASVTWTLGATEGTQTLTVTSTNTLTGSPLSVTATAEYKPKIGDFKYGGVIFYIDETGEHGLVCAVTDQSTNVTWGCSGTTTGATGTEIGTGASNTTAVEAECTDPGTAADICANLTLNGYDDWFLPSEDELEQIYQNRVVIDASATANSGTVFANDNYWSSSETSDIGSISLNFADGENGAHENTGKASSISLRAVRIF